MKVNHILVPTDFSDASLEAVKMAAEMVGKYRCTVDLIHVTPLLAYYEQSMKHLGVPFDMEEDVYPKILQEASDKLHEIAETYIPKEFRGQLINLVGRKPAQIIANKANESQCDLVIMSNKGGHESKEVRSNITEKVIRYSHKPVLSLSESLTNEQVNEILVPVDGSENSIAPLMQAFHLALLFDARITLLHIIEPYNLGMEVIPMTIEDDLAVYKSIMKSIEEYFEKHSEMGFEVKRTGVDFEDRLVYTKDDGKETSSVKFVSIVKKGFSAHTEICDYGNKNTDLVVMSTHGRTGLARVLLGSTTGVVAQHLKKPLLTMHPDL